MKCGWCRMPEIWATKLDPEVEAIHALAQGRNAWLQVCKGEVSVNGEMLTAGRRCRNHRPGQDRKVRSTTEAAELLLFDLG